jgi:hypothetical protein
MQPAQVDVGFSDLNIQQVTLRTWEGKSWQTIVKKIRVVVSKVGVNRLRAVKAMDKRLAAGKVSKADSKVARVANKVVRTKKVVSRATANSDAGSR